MANMNGTEFARINGKYSTAFIGTYEVTSQNISGNYTNFKIRVYAYYGGGTSTGSDTGTVWISGTQYNIGAYRLYPGYRLMAEKDITIYHSNDGSFPYTTVAFAINSYHANGEVSGQISASKIPRQANVTSATDFTDETNPTIKYNNPGGFRINAKLEFGINFGTVIRRDNISNTGSYTFNLTESERNLLRQKCTGNSMTVRETIATCIGGTTENYWSWQDKTMTLVNANPTFNNFTFEDIDSKILSLTGNNQIIVKGYSDVKVTIPVGNRAYANKQAIMSGYRFACGDKSQPISYSQNSNVEGIIWNVPNGAFNVYAIDSRNNATLITKLASREIDYTPLGKTSFTVQRTGGVSEQTTLSVNGTINQVNFGAKTNTIKQFKYRYKVTGGSWSPYISVTPTISNGKFSFSSQIPGDTDLGFNIANSYNFEFYVEDELSNVTFTATLGSGTPNIAFHKNGTAIGGKYDTSIASTLQVHTNKNFSSLIVKSNQYGGPGIAVTDGNQQIGLQIGESSTNRGIWDKKNGKWLFYYDDSYYRLNGNRMLYGAVSLYDNGSGNNGTVTLSDSSANYSMIEIYAKNNDGWFGMVKVKDPNGKSASITITTPYDGNTNRWDKSKVFSISGTTISNNSYSETLISQQNGIQLNNNNFIYITKVIGYR